MNNVEKNYKKQILYRTVVTCLLLLIQLAWIVVLVLGLSFISKVATVIFQIMAFVMVIYIINKDLNPSFKIAWIVPILLFPIPGSVFYFLFGDAMPKSRLKKRLSDILAITERYKKQDEGVLRTVERTYPRLACTNKYLNGVGYPVYKNTDVKYFSAGEKMFKSMMEEMEKAEHYIFVEYFIVEEGVMWNSMLELMSRKVKEGLDVRMIYDDVGSLAKIPGDYYKKIQSLGIKTIRFNPLIPVASAVINHRDHRKIMVIDGHTAFTGGINLSDEYINVIDRFGYWKDTGIRVKGDAVWSFTLMFLEMWDAHAHEDPDFRQFIPSVYGKHIDGSGIVQPYADSPLDDELTSENVYMELIGQATKYVYIMTPYLILDNELKSALCLCAKRGVDVRIVTPGIPDKKMVYRQTRANYHGLLKAGVKIYEFTPGFVHAKSFVVDDYVGIVGTVNLDYRSLYLHFECAALFADCQAVMDLKKDTLETIERSSQVSVRTVYTKSLLTRIADSIIRVFSPLL